jgi:hypothetical protein
MTLTSIFWILGISLISMGLFGLIFIIKNTIKMYRLSQKFEKDFNLDESDLDHNY